jgi:hypothetical protein
MTTFTDQKPSQAYSKTDPRTDTAERNMTD